jgi:hypothetical protein
VAKDFEATIASAQAFLYAASVILLTRRLARYWLRNIRAAEVTSPAIHITDALLPTFHR